MAAIRIGCAGWSLPRELQDQFGPGDSHLARYATRFTAVEINSSFHRPHRRWLYEKWAQATPAGFGFCAKLPRAITHEKRLVDCAQPLAEFMDQVGGLGDKLRCLLVQLPPSFAFDATLAASFFALLRSAHDGAIALEPRHASWFEAPADALLRELRIVRVLADPVRVDAGRWPGGWPGLVYLRLHGTPRMYYSSYGPQLLRALAGRMAQEAGEVWCIFDNTASGAATANGLELARLSNEGRQDLLGR